MKTILEELFFGNIDPNTKAYKIDSPYNKATNIVAKNEETLLELLDGKENRLFREFSDAYSEMEGITSIDRFIFGFKLGALIMTEVFIGSDDIANL